MLVVVRPRRPGPGRCPSQTDWQPKHGSLPPPAPPASAQHRPVAVAATPRTHARMLRQRPLRSRKPSPLSLAGPPSPHRPVRAWRRHLRLPGGPVDSCGCSRGPSRVVNPLAANDAGADHRSAGQLPTQPGTRQSLAKLPRRSRCTGGSRQRTTHASAGSQGLSLTAASPDECRSARVGLTAYHGAVSQHWSFTDHSRRHRCHSTRIVTSCSR